MSGKPVLFPLHLCETRSGNLAHTVGRIAFRRGRPMLVEHVGGVYLEHDLQGQVVTPGYGEDFDIIHVFEENRGAA
jgi:FtsP/CotA-like multicopper oxidase with cupredoxin domain